MSEDWWAKGGVRPVPEREWIDVTGFDGKPEYIPGRCLHTRLVPVDLALTGEVVAQLCRTCDAQLPADWAGRLPGEQLWWLP